MAMDSSVAKKEAKSKKTTPARLLELSYHPDPSVQLVVSKHPNTPVAALEYLSSHGKVTIVKEIAKHPNTPSAILERLALHQQRFRRRCAAGGVPVARESRLACWDAWRFL